MPERKGTLVVGLAGAAALVAASGAPMEGILIATGCLVGMGAGILLLLGGRRLAQESGRRALGLLALAALWPCLSAFVYSRVETLVRAVDTPFLERGLWLALLALAVVLVLPALLVAARLWVWAEASRSPTERPRARQQVARRDAVRLRPRETVERGSSDGIADEAAFLQ